MVNSGTKWVIFRMFMGEYQHTIDQKGRIIMPAKIRTDLGEKFIITKGLDSCLFVYPEQEWKILEDKLKKLPFTNKNARNFSRFFFSGAIEVEFDKQGRVLIPNNLRSHANLEKDVVIIGVSTRLEMWNKEKWDSYNAETQEEYEDLAEKMLDFEINL